MRLTETSISKGKIFESDRAKLPKGVLCRGTWSICNIGKRNQNNRIYSKEVWEKVQSDPMIQEKLKNRTLFGQAEHPKSTQSDLQLTSHVVTGFKIDEENGKLYQDIDILDTPCGQIINTLIEAGCQVGVSTRAEGELRESKDDEGSFHEVVPESFRYVSTDFTADPSTFGTMPLNLESSQLVKSLESVVNTTAPKSAERAFATSLIESIQKEAKEQGDVDPLELAKEDDKLSKEEDKKVQKHLKDVLPESLTLGTVLQLSEMHANAIGNVVRIDEESVTVRTEDGLLIRVTTPAEIVIGDEMDALPDDTIDSLPDESIGDLENDIEAVEQDDYDDGVVEDDIDIDLDTEEDIDDEDIAAELEDIEDEEDEDDENLDEAVNEECAGDITDVEDDISDGDTDDEDDDLDIEEGVQPARTGTSNRVLDEGQNAAGKRDGTGPNKRSPRVNGKQQSSGKTCPKTGSDELDKILSKEFKLKESKKTINESGMNARCPACLSFDVIKNDSQSEYEWVCNNCGWQGDDPLFEPYDETEDRSTKFDDDAVQESKKKPKSARKRLPIRQLDESYEKMVDFLEAEFGKLVKEQREKLSTILSESVAPDEKPSEVAKQFRKLRINEAIAKAERDTAVSLYEGLQYNDTAHRTLVKKRLDYIRKQNQLIEKKAEKYRKGYLKAMNERRADKKQFEKKLEEAKQAANRQLIQEYVDIKADFHNLKLSDTHRALLNECKSVEQVDKRFGTVIESAKIEALLPSKVQKITESRHSVADTKTVEFSMGKLAGELFSSMNR